MTPRSISEFPVQQALNGANAVIVDLGALYTQLRQQDVSIEAGAAAAATRATIVARWDRHLRTLSAALGRGSRHIDRLCVPYWMLLLNVNREIDRHLGRAVPSRAGGSTSEVDGFTAAWSLLLPVLRQVALGTPAPLPLPA